MPDDDTTEVSEATEADATDVSEASDIDNKKKVKYISVYYFTTCAKVLGTLYFFSVQKKNTFEVCMHEKKKKCSAKLSS